MGPSNRPSIISLSPEVFDITNPAKMELDPSEMKVYRNTTFPPDFNQKVDLDRVNLEVLKQCVSPLLHSALPATDYPRHYLERCGDFMGDDDIAPQWGWELLTQGKSVSPWHESPVFALSLTSSAAKYQVFPDQDVGLLAQACRQILKGAVGPVLERAGKPQWCSPSTPRGQEGRA